MCLEVSVPQKSELRPNASALLATGPLGDLLTHLCYLGYLFIGEHEHVSTSWITAPHSRGGGANNLQVLVEGAQATARLGFSADSQPDTFTIRVQGTRMQAQTNLFEVGVVTTTLMGGPKPLMPIRNMLRRGRAERRNAFRSLGRKLSGGPGALEGLWEVVRRFHEACARGTEPPISPRQILATNRLLHDIISEAPQPCAC
jgi:hypothetical protein